MPRDILVEPDRGQRVIVNPKGGLKVTKASIGASKLTAQVVVEGVYVEPVPPPVDAVPTIIAGPTVSAIAKTSVRVSWSTSEATTGQVEVRQPGVSGTKLTVPELSFDYATHSQLASGLKACVPGSELRVIGKDKAGQSYASAWKGFETDMRECEPPPTPDPPGTPAGPYLVEGIYGPAVGIDTRSNLPIGPSGQRASYRFVASQSSVPTYIALNVRGGSGGYSGGNGGTMRVAIQTDVTGEPSGTDLQVAQWNPGNPGGDWENKARHAFSVGPALIAGDTYHLVFSNTHADPDTNFVSVNAVWANSTGYGYPAFTTDFATLLDSGGWSLREELPVFDLLYANSQHDGQAFFGITGVYSQITSTTHMVRERFTPTETRTVNRLGFRVARQSGSGDLTIRLEDSGGTSIVSGTVAAATFPLTGVALSGSDLYGSEWGEVTVADTVLTSGTTYNLRASCAAGTIYWMHDMHEHDEVGTVTWPEWESRGFPDGKGQRTTDGSTWSDIYAFADQDAQCYMAYVP